MDRALRVGFLIDRLDPARGGAERALAALARHLEERGCDVRAFGLEAADGWPGTFHPVRVSGVTRSSRERKLGRALVDAAREGECDVTIGVRHLPEVDVYWPHGGAHRESMRAARRARGRSPERLFLLRHRVFLEFEQELLAEGGARSVVCVSRAVARELAEAYPACSERMTVVENGVDRELFHPRNRDRGGAKLRAELGMEPLDPETPLLAFAARNPLIKGLPVLLDALARRLDEPWHLLVAGPRHLSRWERLARARGLPAERATFRSQVEPASLHAAADLTVLPTWRDTSGLAILESLSTGTPVVTTRCAGAAGAIASLEAGTILEEPGDVEALSRAIGLWLARIRAGLVSRETARERLRESVSAYDVSQQMERMEAVVRNAVRPAPDGC